MANKHVMEIKTILKTVKLYLKSRRGGKITIKMGEL